MADKTVTITSVRGAGATKVAGEAGIAIGMVLYEASGKLLMAKRTTTLAVAGARYVALTYAGLNENITAQGPGSTYNPGFAVVVGEIYVVGTGFGGIEALSAISGVIPTGHFLTIVGFGKTTSLIQLIFQSAPTASL